MKGKSKLENIIRKEKIGGFGVSRAYLDSYVESNVK